MAHVSVPGADVGVKRNQGLLHLGEVETVISASPSPEVVALGPPLNRHISNASSIGVQSRASFSPQQSTPRALKVNPYQIISKQYIQILRRHNMAHCDKNQVLYRVDNMNQETLQVLTKALIETVEEFMDAYDEASAAISQQRHCMQHHQQFPTSQHQKDQNKIVGGPQDNSDSAHNTGGGNNTLGVPSRRHSGERSDDIDEPQQPLSHASSGLPNGLRNWRNNQHQLLSVDQPGLASFASVMTTGSLRSMDERQQITETNFLRKSQDDDGNKVINRYSVLADLGRGAFGKVKLGVNNETNETVAIKIVKKSILKRSSDPMALNREIAILKKVRHQNVVSLYEVIDDPDSDKLYLVMQYVCNGPVVRVKNDFTCVPLAEETCKSYLKQLLSGVRYLHKRHIVHHDIKPDNILLGGDGMVYITDFGVSEVFSAEQSLSESTRRGVGTPIFSAPELLAAKLAEGFGCPPDVTASMESFMSDTDSQAASRKPRERSNSGTFDGVASDTWALGVTTFLLLVGRAPFVGRNYQEVADAVQFHPFEWTGVNTQGVRLNPLWREVLQGMLEKDPKQRWTLKRVKNHAVFLDSDADEPKVIGAMKKQASRAIMITKSELSHATTRISGFLVDEEAPFSRAASTVAKNYVSKLRQRVSSTTQPSLTPPHSIADHDLTAVSSGSVQIDKFAQGSPLGGHPDGGHGETFCGDTEEVGGTLTKRVTMPFAASPPKEPSGSPNPRKSLTQGAVSPNYPVVECEAPPNFDEVFSVRRPTIAGAPLPKRRRTSFPSSCVVSGEEETITPEQPAVDTTGVGTN